MKLIIEAFYGRRNFSELDNDALKICNKITNNSIIELRFEFSKKR